MSKKEIEEIKEQLKQEILADIEKKTNKGDWKEYSDTELEPKLEKVCKDNRRKVYQLKTALCTIIRLYNKKRSVLILNEEEISKTKYLVDMILNELDKK